MSWVIEVEDADLAVDGVCAQGICGNTLYESNVDFQGNPLKAEEKVYLFKLGGLGVDGNGYLVIYRTVSGYRTYAAASLDELNKIAPSLTTMNVLFKSRDALSFHMYPDSE